MRQTALFFIFISTIIGCGDDDTSVVTFELRKAFAGSVSLDISSTPTEEVPVDRSITLVFSEKVDPNSIDEGIDLMYGGQKIETISSVSSDENIVNVSTNGVLQANTLYTLVLTETLRSSTGVPVVPTTFSFKTKIDDLELISANANSQEIESSKLQNVPVDLVLEFVFNSEIDLNSFEEAFTLPRVVSNVSLSSDGKTAIVQSSQPLDNLQKYEASISNQLKGNSGNSFEGYSFEFYTQLDSTFKFPEITDEELLTKIQQQTFKYFWDFGHPVSGLARERNTSGNTVTIGGSGFGVMSILVGIERGFITRQEGVDRLETIVNFLENADRFHGVWPHWMNGNTGATIPFSADDDGADLVETAFMIQGLLAVRAYLDGSNTQELAIKNKITTLWEEVEWSWFVQAGDNALTWHWSPNVGFQKNLKIRGWNEALIIYVLAAASPTHSISKEIYELGWARNGAMQNGDAFYGTTLPLGSDRGGPLFFSHYSFLGLDPRNLEDQYANYWEQNVAHSTINGAYCVANPLNYVGYGENAWGLTASDNHEGYSAHSPNNDKGVITPTAAISSLPYTPEASMAAIHHFYYLMGDKLWGDYGFYDAYNVTENWYASSYLAIDQGPIVIMIENHRTALLWTLFMSDTEVLAGLDKLGFTY
ncbi:hypothetical protein E1176_18065 [Fulvivirga sp. RKSG066]|uniref:glucoamylase family protein n=1 Tax=Fulvivirga aurantia TaxID=2529383 RepID=UPI0012BCBBFC|nr:glucoamylase family protein [Fulvivirga aurantia]MTI22941.1 hypothetical protein [Fulvivirga aurantia]